MNLRVALAAVVCIIWTLSTHTQAEPTGSKRPELTDQVDCQQLLKNLTRDGLTRNTQLRDLTPNVMEQLKRETGNVSVLATWAFRGDVDLDQLMRIPTEAQKAGVNVLVQYSKQSSFQHSSLSQPLLLSTFVFKGSTENLTTFFTTISRTPNLTLAMYEVLQALPLRNSTEFLTFQVVALPDRPRILNEAVRSSADHLVLFNDIKSKSFLAVIGPQTYEDYLRATHRTPKITPVDEEQLARSWNEFAPKVASNETVLLVKEVNRSLAYVTSLSDLADIQSLRVNQFLSYQRLLSVVAGTSAPERQVVGEMVQRPSSQFEFVSVSISDFLIKRSALFGPQGEFTLSAKRPVFQIRQRTTPDYVGFLPEWLKTAPVEEVERAYRRFADLSTDEPLPESILKLIANYQSSNSYESAAGFHSASLSDLDQQKMRNLFKSNKPLIFTPGRRDKNAQPLSFVLLPIHSGRF